MAHIIELKDEVYEMLKEDCLEIVEHGTLMTVDQIMEVMMDEPEVPMHYPYHHFILPAALLTATALEEKIPMQEIDDMLNVAIDRAKNILGGFCGNYGACGSGVGAGMFLSIYTDTSPMSGKSWQWANELTGICLQKIAEVEGPRCCKRTGFLSIQAAIPYINDKLNMHLGLSDRITCKYSKCNPQCKKKACPFYTEE